MSVTTDVPTIVEETPAPALTFDLPTTQSAEAVILGRQPNNDGDNSGAMFFE
ncbi:hypothetical protein AB0C11_33555 [Streptomyces sp. NPDC039016]|uniref:hypothetical protein n=1 Tax=Streptomyces TaxID=1883 RepID=UPI0015E10535|nr:hypothetical protein [Streptomyces noursei]